SNAASSNSTSAASKTSSSGATRSFKLGDNTIITVTANEVQSLSIPATSFAEDIDRLNAMWDDTSSYGKNDSIVKICDHAIALVYLPDIFKKKCVVHYRQSTPDEFWAKFSKDGRKLSYTAICARLRNERKSTDKELAEQARQEYGSEFEGKFRYRCSRTNTWVVMTKDSSIAKEYKHIRNL
ncbi:hypothetical protein GGX14DRAFT_348899, partial [Mycena pura]